MRYSLLAGGKRIRPVLALATARAVGIEQREVLPLAGAIELIHTYSLIHDDLPAMDDDELRRGAPTCHVTFGEDVAILAGDGLYAEAFRHLLTAPALGARARAGRARPSWPRATGVNGMVGGQYVDVKAARRVGPGGAAAPARAEDRASDRRVGALRTTVDGDRRGAADGSLPALRRGARRAVPDRRRHTRRDRHRRRTWKAARQRRASRQAHLRERVRDRARRELAARVAPDGARGARRGRRGAPHAPTRTAELEQITDFIYTRTS